MATGTLCASARDLQDLDGGISGDRRRLLPDRTQGTAGGAADRDRADDALRHALDNVRLMDEALAHAAAQFGTRVKILDHPILGPLNIRQWRKFHWVHTRHHARQIRQRTAGPVGGP